RTTGPADLGTFREVLNTLGLGEISLQSFGDKNSILVRAQRHEGGEEAQTASVTKLNAEVAKIDPTATIEGDRCEHRDDQAERHGHGKAAN
ncbi:hypothetical protein ACC758_38540, partial [Rhizobium ruizarguesonis]